MISSEVRHIDQGGFWHVVPQILMAVRANRLILDHQRARPLVILMARGATGLGQLFIGKADRIGVVANIRVAGRTSLVGRHLKSRLMTGGAIIGKELMSVQHLAALPGNVEGHGVLHTSRSVRGITGMQELPADRQSNEANHNY
ncbi:MAG: hypothetical protein O3B74_12245, partial [Proteobacteria bacterium]|nr:hypothetical protein [Pseudomonadota bacterium]